MRIVELKTLRADGGWRPFSFLKISTDAGLTGWSEFLEAPWSPALDQVILALGRSITGEDPRRFARLSAQLHAQTQFTAGGLSHQAIAAIENACIDLAAKAHGIPVYALFGGPFRDAVDVYWSHCGSFRARDPDLFERILHKPRLASLDDVKRLGIEAAERGFKAVKTNPMVFEKAGPRLLNPGFAPGMRFDRVLDTPTVNAIVDQMLALREGLGPDRELMLDVNFSCRAESLRRLARAIAPSRPMWLEADLHDAPSLRTVKDAAGVPLASLESLHGRRAYKPYLDANAVDFAIVDVMWNGFAEAVRIASMAEAFDVNVAPHNFNGPLGDLISAHFCAAAGNVAIMEIEGDDIPWKYSLITRAPQMAAGRFLIPAGAGWGADVEEHAVAAHPWKG
jgi:galactonate dehydratase